MRTLAAFLIAPLTPFIFGLTALLIDGSDTLFGVTGIITIIAYAVAIVVGIPAYFLMKKMNIYSLKGYLFVGALISLTCAIIYLFPSIFLINTVEGIVKFVGLFGSLILLIGLSIVSIFWIIARPDKSHKEV